jgi:hypothetical protein
VGGAILRLGGAGGLPLLRGGMEGTGRVMTEGVRRAGGDGVGRMGGDVLRLGIAGGGRDAGGGILGGVGGVAVRTGGGGALFGGGGALDGGGGTVRGGSGTVREGKLGARRVGGTGGGGAGGVSVQDFEGDGASTAIAPSRLGIDGGLPSVGGFAAISRMR